MPLTDEQKAAVKSFGEAIAGVTSPADLKDLSAEVKTVFHPLWKTVRDEGHKKGLKDAETNVTAATTERDNALKEVERLEAALEEASKGNPDVDRVRAEAKTALDAAKLEAKKREDDLTAELRKRDLDGHVATFESIAGSLPGGGIRKAWLRALRNDPEFRKRLDLDKDKKLVVKAAGKETAIDADDETPEGLLRALALEYREKYKVEEPDSISVPTDDGPGVESGSATATGEQAYDPVKEGKEMARRQMAPAKDNIAFR